MLALGLLLPTRDIQESATPRGHSGKALGASFSADGKYLVTGGEDRTVKIREVATGKLVRAISGHRAFVNRAALSSDGHVYNFDAAEVSALIDVGVQIKCLVVGPADKVWSIK